MISRFTTLAKNIANKFGQLNALLNNIPQPANTFVGALQQEIAFEFADSLVGYELDVLIDAPSDEEEGIWIGRSYADEPEKLIKQLAADEAIQEADTLLLTVPNQLGVEYNAHVIEAILKHVAPALGWR